MNKELLFQLYRIHSRSGSEKKMRRYLRKVAAECGAEEIVTDAYGNLLITKGQSKTYPCLAAHMDQVQDAHSKDFTVVEIGGDVIGYSPKMHEQQGLGADDKNGIFICLELLRKFDVMKVAFFVGEEIGCKGSGEVDLEFFKDCRFIVQPDRKGSSDLITAMFCGSVCSEDFINAIGYEAYGYKKDHGTVTDVGELVDRGVGISCLNLSCGYYEAHSDQEITVLSELENCLNFVEHIVETCTDVYPFEGGYGDWDYGYGRYGYHWFGGSKWYSGENKEPSVQTGQKSSYIQTAQGSQSDWDEDDWDYYFDGGYYDQDVCTMETLLGIDPTLSLDRIMASYKDEFMACICFSARECENQISDIYYEVKDALYNETYWNGLNNDDDDDDAAVGDLSFDSVSLKKVS